MLYKTTVVEIVVFLGALFLIYLVSQQLAMTAKGSSGSLSVTTMAMSQLAKMGYSFNDSKKHLLPHKQDEISDSITCLKITK